MNKTLKQIIKIYNNNNDNKMGQQKNRSKINYSNKKIRPQKGMGKSRISNKKSPIFIGGGRTFPAIKTKTHNKINKKMIYFCIFKQLIIFKKFNRITRHHIDNKNNKPLDILLNNKFNTYNKLLIIYKKINNYILKKIINTKNIKIIREDKINPLILNHHNNIILINDSLKWLKKLS